MARLPRLPRLAPLAASLGLAACTEPTLGQDGQPIIGGTLTPDGEFPGVGALLYDLGSGRPETGCTGTLIAPTVVLTAAHCVDPALGGDALVAFTLAHDTVSAAPPMTMVASKTKHEQFDLGADITPGLGKWFDIGLVVLQSPITEVPPVRLPRPTDGLALTADTDITIVGYGRTSDATNDVGVMFDSVTKLASVGDWELQIGAGGGQPQNCNGDSGGPALIEIAGVPRVVGVVSRSFDAQPGCRNGGIDTRVDAYLDWIFAQMPADVPCGSGLAPACADDDDEGGCCSTGGSAGGPLALGVLVAGLVLRRRRR